MHMGKHKCVNVNNCFECHMKTQEKKEKMEKVRFILYYEHKILLWNLWCTLEIYFYLFFLGDNKWYLGQKDYVGEERWRSLIFQKKNNNIDWRTFFDGGIFPNTVSKSHFVKKKKRKKKTHFIEYFPCSQH